MPLEGGKMKSSLKSMALVGASALVLVTAAHANEFNIPSGELTVALDVYMKQSGVALMYSSSAVRGVHTAGARGETTATVALSRILAGTGFEMRRDESGAVAIVPARAAGKAAGAPTRELAQAPTRAAAAGVETVVVTSSKIKGDIQTVPIAITALSQEQLTSRQIAGGPDLVKEVPNLTFSKTNFTGYNIEIRGIGTQAISVTTDPAVAVAFNDIPFIRNHFFEQEFYDVAQVEVLRGPQGTLYGRNATAGVVNVISAKPTDQFEAMASADFGNYNNRRYEGMVNIPIVDDRLDLRVAGEWTKRDGYSFNELTDKPIDGRDLWSGRVTLGWKPVEDLQVYLVWEHFQENDDRLRSSKQLCKTDDRSGTAPSSALGGPGYASQGCLPVSLYSPEAFEVPNGDSLPFVLANVSIGPRMSGVDPYTATTQSRDLHVIQSTLDPTYGAKNNVIELNADYSPTPTLTFTSQTAFNQDFLYSTEDYNRFDTTPGVFFNHGPGDTVVVANGEYRCRGDFALTTDPSACTGRGYPDPMGTFCDPQLGCSDRLVGEDFSKEHAWQLSQEFRVASHFSGPLNFSAGGNYLHYETAEDYYVFINALTLFSADYYDLDYSVPGKVGTQPYMPGISDNSNCAPQGFAYPDLSKPQGFTCPYIDPNPIAHVNGKGHNYFRSYNPYVLNSYATFGEAEYDPLRDLKLTAGLRWTEDQKHFTNYPSEVLVDGWGYPSTGTVNQKWGKLTGRFVANWTPKLDFTDQTLVYGSFSHGYKAGGANPPGAILLTYGGYSGPPQEVTEPIHPLTFKPEFVDAYELGTKNTLLDGALTLNGDVFFYNYKGYQISEIVDRTSINLNFDATVKGAELEGMWQPLPGLKFTFADGYEDTTVANGSKAIDLMDRTAGVPGWFVSRPFITQASNCILPVGIPAGSCGVYVVNPDSYNAPNNGEGFDKDLSGKQLPNAPHFTSSLSAEYTVPVSEDWAATLHTDFYWQSQSFARIFDDRPYDKLRGYSNLNLALILTSADGWQVMGYIKNNFNTTAITGDFLNSDDTGLTTNVFLTDPRLFGVRVTKNW
jgi:iron complex outermembrane receptor protein